MIIPTHKNPVRWATAIIRLAALRQHCTLHVAGEGTETHLQIYFFSEGPKCRCCNKLLPRETWLTKLAGGFEKELTCLVQAEDTL